MFDLHDRLKTVRIWLVRDVIHVIVFGQFYLVLKPTCESLFDYFWRWQDVHIAEMFVACWKDILKLTSRNIEYPTF